MDNSPIPATYLSPNAFSVSGTGYSTQFVAGMRVQADCAASGIQYGVVSSVSNLAITLTMDAGNALTAKLVSVLHGNDRPDSLANHDHKGPAGGGRLAHASLSGTGTNTHDQLDAHLAAKANPHGVTAAQVGLGSVTNHAQVKRTEMGAAGGVGTLDAAGRCVQPPAGHASQHAADGPDPVAQLPTGACFYFGGPTPPAGSLERNGAAISRTAYAALFAVIGTTFGAGDGVNTFNLPDSRAMFDRGWDHGRGIDSSRTFGSTQQDQTRDHWHYPMAGLTNQTMQLYMSTGGNFGVAAGTVNNARTASAVESGQSRYADGDTRPYNIAFLPCIKY